MEPTILTSTGQYFRFKQPELHPYDIEEIAHALSHVCRYTGHCNEFYSVAQHSVMVALVLPKDLQLQGLMHDASEAYLGDVSSPLKALLPEYKTLEERVERAISWHFKLPFPLDPAIKHADMRMLMTEKRDLMIRTPQCEQEWPNFQPFSFRVRPVPSAEAKGMFLALYTELTGEAVKGWN